MWAWIPKGSERMWLLNFQKYQFSLRQRSFCFSKSSKIIRYFSFTRSLNLSSLAIIEARNLASTTSWRADDQISAIFSFYFSISASYILLYFSFKNESQQRSSSSFFSLISLYSSRIRSISNCLSFSLLKSSSSSFFKSSYLFNIFYSFTFSNCFKSSILLFSSS